MLIENHIDKIEAKIEKDCLKAAKRIGANFNRDQFIANNSRVLDRKKEIEQIKSKFEQRSNQKEAS